MTEWPKRFSPLLFLRSLRVFYTWVFKAMFACVGISAFVAYFLWQASPQASEPLNLYFSKVMPTIIGATVGSAVLGFLVGTPIVIRRRPMVRLDDDYLSDGSSRIPLRQVEELAIDHRRFLGPVLWVTVDGTRRGIPLPNDPGIVAEVERHIRSSTANSPQAAGDATPPPKIRPDCAAADTASAPIGPIEWPEEFANNQLFRWILPVLASFSTLIFALAGVGAIAAHLVTLLRPDMRMIVLRQYFGLATVTVGYFLIFFGGGGLTVAVLRNRSEPGMVRLKEDRIVLRERHISLFRIAAAEVRRRRLRGPLLRLLVDGRWIGVGLPRDGESITKIAELLRSRGKTVRDAART